jgi:NitT/TauT family transport system ATP-binding protein
VTATEHGTAMFSEDGERTAAVVVDRVTKTYETRDGEIEALAETTLDFREHEFVSIVGPSGCGKSTLMLMIAGLIPVTSGEVRINGTVVRKPYTDLGIVFQDPVLLDWRKVLSNLMIQVEARGLEKKRYEPRARELLELTGLAGREQAYPFELSGGMRQRVSICRALLHDPPLLLMDEPFGALDALTRDQMNLDVQALWMRSPKTVFFVTHSITEAVFMSDRVVVMSPSPGRVVEIIDIAIERPRRLDVRTRPEFGIYTDRIRELFSSLGVLREDV